MRSNVGPGVLVLTAVLSACGGDEARGPGPAPDVFRFDSGGAYHIEGFGAWRVTASRDGRFQATHDVRGDETVYDEVVLDASARDALWTAVDEAWRGGTAVTGRPGVPDEVRLTFRLERASGETLEIQIWQNDARDHAGLQALLEALRRRIERAYGVRPVF